MPTVEGSLSKLILTGAGSTRRWLRQIAKAGDLPKYHLSEQAHLILGDSDNPLKQQIFSFLHTHNYHVYCYCLGTTPAVSHIKCRDGFYFPARNAQSPEHAHNCVFYHSYTPKPVGALAEVDTPDSEPYLDLIHSGLAGLKNFYINLILEAGRDVWKPGQSFLSAKDWVTASEQFQLLPTINLKRYFKAREAYIDDLLTSLESSRDAWPRLSRPHGVVYVRPREVNTASHEITLQSRTLHARRLLCNEDGGAMAGLLVIEPDGTVPLAIILPCAGLKQDMPLASAGERRLCAYLMRILSYWHENEKYKQTLELTRPWRKDGIPDVANFIVRNSDGKEVPILMLTGDVDDGPRRHAFDLRYGESGTHFDLHSELGQRVAEKNLNDTLFKALVARKKVSSSSFPTAQSKSKTA